MIELSVINTSNNPLPKHQTDFSAGVDLMACLENETTINPMERKLIGTGIYIALPTGYEAQIRPRSGLALKNGITVLNSPGTIDADYRGEIKVLLINLSTEQFVITNGDRIAQMIVSKHETINFTLTDKLTETIRSDGGYGHTGIN